MNRATRKHLLSCTKHLRDSVVVRESTLQSVDLGFISYVESYQKTLKNGIHSFPAWRSAKTGIVWRTSLLVACP